MNIYKYISYREIIRKVVLSRRRLDSRFNFQNLADAMRVQSSYLSQVLKGKAELNADQLFLALEALGFNEEESEYMNLLLEYSRCGLRNRQKLLKQKIEAIQNSKLQSQEYLDVTLTETNSQTSNDYYLDCYNQLIHVCLSNPSFRKDPVSGAAHLGLTKERVRQVLQELIRLKVIALKENEIRVLRKNLHLKNDAKVFPPWRTQMRQIAASRLLALSSNDDVYSFSVILSTEKSVRDEIQQAFLEFIHRAQSISKNTSPDHVYQMNFDLIPWL